MTQTIPNERALFLLDPAVANLNQGSFGAVPAEILTAQAEIARAIEANPTRYISNELRPELRRIAGEVARRFGGSGDDWVFVSNATEGANIVVQSLDLKPGDEVVTTDHVYNGVRTALRYYCERAGAVYREAALPPPLSGPEEVIAALAPLLGPRTRMVAIDHLTSATATVMPVAQITALCRAHGIPVFVDGAHAPGQIPLDVPALGADWYVGNAHKWLFAPRGTALFWCTKARQAEVRPAVLSHGFGQGYHAAFDWTGTRDPSVWATLPAALAFHDRLGGAALMAANRAKAETWADRLCRAWGAVPSAPPSMRAAMASLRLPSSFSGDQSAALALRQRLSDEFKIETPVWSFGGRLWLRFSVQVYVSAADIDRLEQAILKLA